MAGARGDERCGRQARMAAICDCPSIGSRQERLARRQGAGVEIGRAQRLIAQIPQSLAAQKAGPPQP
jgi:hypothetical protein